MKKLALLSMLLLGSPSVFAGTQYLDLSAGSQVRVRAGDETIVRCDGSSEQASPRCTLSTSTSGWTNVLIDGKQVGTLTTSIDKALLALKKYKEAGLCN